MKYYAIILIFSISYLLNATYSEDPVVNEYWKNILHGDIEELLKEIESFNQTPNINEDHQPDNRSVFSLPGPPIGKLSLKRTVRGILKDESPQKQVRKIFSDLSNFKTNYLGSPLIYGARGKINALPVSSIALPSKYRWNLKKRWRYMESEQSFELLEYHLRNKKIREAGDPRIVIWLRRSDECWFYYYYTSTGFNNSYEVDVFLTFEECTLL